jgi:hypothetical protein
MLLVLMSSCQMFDVIESKPKIKSSTSTDCRGVGGQDFRTSTNRISKSEKAKNQASISRAFM